MPKQKINYRQLREVILHGDVNQASKLLKKRLKPIAPRNLRSLLCRSAANGHFIMVGFLLRRYSAVITNEIKLAAYYVAVQNQKFRIADLLKPACIEAELLAMQEYQAIRANQDNSLPPEPEAEIAEYDKPCWDWEIARAIRQRVTPPQQPIFFMYVPMNVRATEDDPNINLTTNVGPRI